MAVLDVVQENCDVKRGMYNRGFNGQGGSQDTMSRVGYTGGYAGPMTLFSRMGPV